MLVLWFGIQRDQTGQRGEEGGEDTRLEDGEVDEVVNYEAENAADSAIDVICVFCRLYSCGEVCMVFAYSRDAYGKSSGRSSVKGKQDVYFLIKGRRIGMRQCERAKND